MVDSVRSNLIYHSNIQLAQDPTWFTDQKFFKTIHDPAGLKILRHCSHSGDIAYQLSGLQQEECQKTSYHCSFAPRGEYPHGTIINRYGEREVVCRCLEINCKYFKRCRPSFYVSSHKSTIGTTVTQPTIVDTTPLKQHIVTIGEDIEEKVTQAATQENIENTVQEASQAIIQETQKDVEPDSNTMILINPKGFSSFEIVDQDTVISSDVHKRIIVNAGPGTGKTRTLIKRIVNLVENQNVEPESILIFCFSRAAIDVIRKRLREEITKKDSYDLERLDFRTLDSFATYLLSWAGNNYKNLFEEGFELSDYSYEERIELAIRLLDKKPDIISLNTHLIIDEVQDIIGCRARFVLKMISVLSPGCGFTILGDVCQGIYDWNLDGSGNVQGKSMSSHDFYEALFSQCNNAKLYAFNKNYRQQSNKIVDKKEKQKLIEALNLLTNYREAILSNDVNEMQTAQEKLVSQIDELNIKLNALSQADIDKLSKGQSLAILTRTNAQALEISNWLNGNSVKHQLQIPARKEQLDEWVARFFINYMNDGQTIDEISKDEFCDCFKKTFPDYGVNEIIQYWSALVYTQKSVSRNTLENVSFKLEDLIKGLLYDARSNLFFKPLVYEESKVIVSNIHRIKGKEFEHTLIIDPVFEDNDFFDNAKGQEYKVRYVALTRAKSHVSKVKMDNLYISRTKDKVRRCFKRTLPRPGRKPLVEKIEIGFPEDVDEKSFAQNEEIQRYITEELKNGTRLVLLKDYAYTSYIRYKIVPEDKTNYLLGYTGEQFYLGITHALNNLFGNNGHIDEKFYPSAFIDVYVEKHITCITPENKDLKGATTVGKHSVWVGLDINGFARKDSKVF